MTLRRKITLRGHSCGERNNNTVNPADDTVGSTSLLMRTLAGSVEEERKTPPESMAQWAMAGL